EDDGDEVEEVIEQDPSENEPEQAAAEVIDDEVETATEAEETETTELDAAMAAADELEDLELSDEGNAAIDRLEAYDDQEETDDMDIDEVKTREKAPPKKKRAAGTGRSRSVDLSKINAEIFVLDTDKEPEDLDANRSDVIARRPSQVKIAQKFDGLFNALATNGKVERYVDIAIRFMIEKGAFTSVDLKNHYLDFVKPGTASSQAGQIMTLFPAAGIAERDGKNLKLRDNSKVVERLKTLLAI
ncbi:MAG: hypothetical protein JJ979_02660, partial [Roseibium sp.]|nr:hypothetical protein [Roseibium sp.]